MIEDTCISLPRIFLSFLRGLDSCVMENANECTFKKHGPEMIDVAVKQMEATREFQQQFKSLINDCLLTAKGY